MTIWEKCADACEHAADVVGKRSHEKFIKYREITGDSGRTLPLLFGRQSCSLLSKTLPGMRAPRRAKVRQMQVMCAYIV